MTEGLDIDQDDDIDVLLEKLEDIRLETDNTALLTAFADEYAYPVCVLLEELKKRRAAARRQGGGDGGRLGTHRIILEGYSEDSMQEAFSNALEKAYCYFSALHDVSVTVLELTHIRSGGHRATIELHITPMTFNQRNKQASADVEQKHRKEKSDKSFREMHAERVKHLLHDHFMQMQEPSGALPDYLLVNVNDAELLNFMTEHDFFHAAHNMPEEHLQDTNEFMVRFVRHEPGNE